MRSRYSAYVLNKPDYIIGTTHPASPGYSQNKFGWSRSLSQFSKVSSFSGLKILDFQERGLFGCVTFVAFLTQEGQEATFTERSYFEKVGEKWFYRNGEWAQGENHQLVKPGGLNLLPLVYYDDPFLRQKAMAVEDITDDVKTLVAMMIDTMDSFSALGLAAPQVHSYQKLFVFRTPLEKEGERVGLGEVQVFIDPKLSDPSSESWKAIEGCLSIPTIRQVVERPKEITVEYTTIEGLRCEKRVSGWEARVVMHENDHLQGTLFIDRLKRHEREEIEGALRDLDKRVHQG